MKIIVQKYGGTSVNTKSNREHILRHVKEAKEMGFSPVIVVSAMGRKPQPYATDALFSLLNDIQKIPPRSKDLLASCGEIITTVVVSEELHLAGIPSEPLTGGQAGIYTDMNYTEASITEINTHRIMSLLEKDVVPVVAGFQGVGTDMEILTLGRGGSDTTATALGAALGAEKVEIYTDVDGVFTTDPNSVQSAYLLENISYENVLALAEFGAKVIHPRAVEFAMKKNVPVRVLNVKKSACDACTTIQQEQIGTFTAIASTTAQNAACISILGKHLLEKDTILEQIESILQKNDIKLLSQEKNEKAVRIFVEKDIEKTVVTLLHRALIK